MINNPSILRITFWVLDISVEIDILNIVKNPETKSGILQMVDIRDIFVVNNHLGYLSLPAFKQIPHTVIAIN